jgi:hypothetical protein
MDRSKRVALSTLGGLILYLSAYFILMEPEPSYDIDTGEQEFGSSLRFGTWQRLPYDISIYGKFTHWTNYFFWPLDMVLRRN